MHDSANFSDRPTKNGTHHLNWSELWGVTTDVKAEIQALKNQDIGAFYHGHKKPLQGRAESGFQFRHRRCQIMLRVVFASACSITVGNSPRKLLCKHWRDAAVAECPAGCRTQPTRCRRWSLAPFFGR